VVFSGVLQTSVSAGGIVIAMCTIPPIAKKGGVVLNCNYVFFFLQNVEK
jgi:hypothetical protein